MQKSSMAATGVVKLKRKPKKKLDLLIKITSRKLEINVMIKTTG